MANKLIWSFAIVAAICGAMSVASAQSLPKDVLPPGAQTIAGPGIATGPSTGVAVWESLVGVNVCATAATTASNANVSINLRPANATRSFSLSTNRAFAFCGSGVTKVTISGPLGATIWRVDKF